MRRAALVLLVVLGLCLPLILLQIHAPAHATNPYFLPPSSSLFAGTVTHGPHGGGRSRFKEATEETRQRPGGCEERLRRFYKKGKDCEPRHVPQTKFTHEAFLDGAAEGKTREVKSLLVVSTCNEIAVSPLWFCFNGG